MAVSLLQYANREKVAQALTLEGYPVTRMTVNRWARGDEMPEIAARMIGGLFGHLDTKEAPPPQWATGLIRTVDAIAEKLGVTDDEQAVAGAVAAALTPPPAGETPPDRAEDGLAGPGRRREHE